MSLLRHFAAALVLGACVLSLAPTAAAQDFTVTVVSGSYAFSVGSAPTPTTPTLTLVRGRSYSFALGAGVGAHPFFLKTATCGTDSGETACTPPRNADNAISGVTGGNTGTGDGNGSTGGMITFSVPSSGALYFQCGQHVWMKGAFNVVDYAVTANGMNGYRFNGDSVDDPTLSLVRGRSYVFGVNAPGHPFMLRDGTGANLAPSGQATGNVSLNVPLNVQSNYGYHCTSHSSMMTGAISFTDPSLGNGSQCAWDAQCQSGYCNGSNVCATPLLANGASCSGDNQCVSQFCLDESPRVCATPNQGPGQACLGHSQCTTNVCLTTTHVCGANNLNNGASCQAPTQCKSGICDGGKCGTAKGKACSLGNQCASNDCEGGICCSGACNATQCNLVACAPSTGACVTTANPDTNLTCNDNQSCTVEDKCNGQGACAGTVSCNDPIAANCADVSTGECGDNGACEYTGTAPPEQVCQPTGAPAGSYSCHDGSCIPDQLAGTTYGWGSIRNGTGAQTATPTLIASNNVPVTFIQTASGHEHTVALAADGSVWTWGDNYEGQLGDGTRNPSNTPIMVDLGRLAIAVAAGRYTSYAILSDGSIRSWGDNRRRQLGTSSVTAVRSLSPVAVSGLYDILAVSAGETHAVALRANGTLVAWGDNTYGQIGNNTSGSTALPNPTNVSAPGTGTARYKAIAAGGKFNVALSVGGQLYVWGSSSQGAAGLLSGNVVRPTVLYGVSVVRAIAAGGSHALAIDHAGGVWAWGDNTYGQLGLGTVDYFAHAAPTPVTRVRQALSIAAGLHNSAAVHADGSLWTWGANFEGQLGDASRAEDDGYPIDSKPQPIRSITDAQSVSLGAGHAVLVRPLNAIKTWGSNAQSLLGANLTTNQRTDATTSLNMRLPSDVQTVRAVSVSGCNSHGLLLSGDGTVWSWGDNSQGQLGVSGAGAPSPIRVPNLPPIIAVAAGCYVSAALAADGRVWTWGFGVLGTLGDGTIESHTTPALVGSLTAITAISLRGLTLSALHGTGRVYTWGYNQNGELGVAPSVPRPAPGGPVAIPGSLNVRAIAQGYSNGFAILENGTLAAWGQNNSGQLGIAVTNSTALPSLARIAPNTTLQNVAMVSAGATSTVAIGNSRRNLLGWGSAYNAQLSYLAPGTYNTAQTLTNGAKLVSTGSYVSGMIHSDGSVLMVGNGSSGSLGNATTTQSTGWVPATGVVHAGALETSSSFALALVPGPAREREYTIEQCAPEVALVSPSNAGPGNSCSVTEKSGQSVRLRGNVLGDDRVYRRGEVMVDGTGVITCVGCDCAATPGFDDAWVIDCPNAVISPGLINTHEHLTCGVKSGEQAWPHAVFSARSDWADPATSPIDHECTQISDAQVAAAEIRHVINGTTSVVGHGRESVSRLLRNLDITNLALIAQSLPDDREGLRARVISDTFPLNAGSAPLPPAPQCMGVGRSHVHGADAEIMHLGEGIDARAQRELSCGIDGALNVVHADQTTLVHAMMITPSQAQHLHEQRAWVSWSPRSNIDLYGNTTPVTLLDQSGVGIALGTDWSVTGSVNLGRELACAADFNRTYLDNRFSDYRLWQMVTGNAALAAGVAKKVGVLKVGALGDIAIFDQAVGIDHSAVVRSEPRTTAFVMRGGWKIFGDSALISALPAQWAEADVTCNPLEICGQTSKQLCGPVISSFTPYLAFCTGATEPSCTPQRPGEYSGVTPTDRDGDGWLDINEDNCPTVFNPSRPVSAPNVLDDDGTGLHLGFQADTDEDGIGDACDACPLPGAPCQALDSNDVDADGVANAADTCPGIADGTADTDTDGIADTCDCTFNWCTRDVAETRDVESLRYVPDLDYVLLNELYVTALVPGAGYFVQADPARLPPISSEFLSDPNHPGNYGNLGIFVATTATPMAHDYNTQTSEPIQVGNRIAVLGQLSGSLAMRTLTVLAAGFHDRGTTLPFAPIDRYAADLASYMVANGKTSGLLAEAFESTWMRVSSLKVAQGNPSGGTPLEFSVLFHNYNSNTWSPLRVDDHLTNYSATIGTNPAAGTLLSSVSGVMHVENGLPKLAPRSASEIVRTP